MIIKNNSEETKITYDSVEHKIPKGDFECSEVLGVHILNTAKKWGLDMEVVNENKNILETGIREIEKEIDVPEDQESIKKELEELKQEVENKTVSEVSTEEVKLKKSKK